MKPLSDHRTAAPPFLIIGLVSAASLAYEILLMRLFSIIQFHHFAYMIISLALLGYGASGTFVAIARERLLARFPAAFLANIALFAVSLTICFPLAQTLQFNPEEVLWSLYPAFRLLAIYLLLSLPFFFAANSVALALAKYPRHIFRTYSADLVGGGLGSLGIVLLLFLVFPGMALRILAALGFSTVALAWWWMRLKPRAATLAFVAGVVISLALPVAWTKPLMSPYKGLSQQMLIPGSKVIARRSSPLGLLTVVENRLVPFRHAPGLSLNAAITPPAQLGLFTDGDAMTVITRVTGDARSLSYLDQLTSALPYHLGKPQRVLILGAGGGVDILQARHYGVGRIDAVELNPQIVALTRDTFAAFAGDLHAAEKVHLHIAEARSFVVNSKERYDLIQLSLLDAFSASSAGLYALNENYLYTREAMREYMRHLTPDGYLAVSRWVKLPPRDALKLVATAITVLEDAGVAAPGQQLILIRGWQTSTLLLKNSPISDTEIAALRSFCEARSFDLVQYPGMVAGEANQYNVLPAPYFFEGAQALLGPEQQQFLSRYKFHIRPATDDAPYFFHYFKWRLLPEIIALRGQGGMALLESGYLLLAATLVQALAVSLALILLPLWFFKRSRPKARQSRGRGRVFVYFAAIGLAFLFLEIAFIQKFILFLSHPLYAATVVLTAFLMFAGSGSAFSARLPRTFAQKPAIVVPVIGIVGLGLLYMLGLGFLFKPLSGLPDMLKILVSILLIAPLAFCMGMPFPMGLTQVGNSKPWLLPWAWGVNGCASVLSAVLATMLAIHFGFTVVVCLALVFYGVAAATFPNG